MSNLIFEDISKLTTEESLKRSKLFLSQAREISEISAYIKEIKEKNKNEENLIIFLRRHWIDFFSQILPIISISLILVVAYAIVVFFGPDRSSAPPEWQIIVFLITIASLFLWVLFFVVFISYYLDVWIVTDERIIDIRQKGLFRREISELSLDNIQDLTTEIAGVIPTLYDFGDLFIQTAGKVARFTFVSIPHPERIRDIILVLSEREK